VNHLEALAQWAYYSRLPVPFRLYVPAGMVDVARRLCEENQIHVSEIWSYHTVADEVRFTLVHRTKEPPPARPARRPARVAAARRKPVRRALKKPRSQRTAARGGTKKARPHKGK
jgi:hypothetical protein